MTPDDFLSTIKANESQFSLLMSGVNDDDISVSDFEFEKDSLCEDYCLTINITCQHPIDKKSLIGNTTKLSIVWGTQDQTISGVVSDIISRGENSEGNQYLVTINSILRPLQHTLNNRVYTNMTVDKVISSVLEKSGFNMAQLDMQATGPELEMIVQYEESDYDFISRLMRKFGFVYSVIEVDGNAKLIVCNEIAELTSQTKKVTLSYQASTGTVRLSESVFGICCNVKMLAESFAVSDYNYEQNAVINTQTQNTSSINGFGHSSHYGENVKSNSEADAIAKTMQAAEDSIRRSLIVDTDCRALRAGTILTIKDHDEYSGDYLVISVSHRGSQRGGVNYGTGVGDLNYKNQCIVVPADTNYKAKLLPNKRVFTTFNATIEEEIDDLGRYVINLPFNFDGEGNPSKPVRLMQPYGGAGHGMHFPLSKGTEVVIAGENGDLDRPIILGALYNQQSQSPVNSNNPTENKLVTKAGHTFVMDDKLGEEKISLYTKDKKNLLQLDATSGAHQTLMQSKEGEVKIQAKKQISMTAEGNHEVVAGGHMSTRVEGSIKIQSREDSIELKSAKDIAFTAESNIRQQAVEGNFEVQSAQKFTVQAEQDTNIHSKTGNLTLQADKGDLALTSGSNVTLQSTGNGSIQLLQGSGSVEIDKGGNLNVDASTITLSAGNIVIKGNAVTNN
ncbi:type VI secretion system Vgr family protein [Flocculibacter collagenilyticus]|uniref:type VI secretion system Vgr family protein n=1 Tax=Flocculibacter collagenilyticus TaxID=2744479 RepID=UPI0018F44777|nr:type VI secretion system tip protein TssI/VgrG [Flocculibacter collagenilyticus]